MKDHTLDGGFDNPPHDSANAFRAIMTAMACPGRIEMLGGASGPAPLSGAAATALLTLCDSTTPLSLAPGVNSAALRAWIAFHTGAPLVSPEDSVFALGRWGDLQPLARFSHGTPEYPDRSATLIVESPALESTGARLTGPGIETEAWLSLPEIAAFQANAARFPLGLDFLFTAGWQIAALPRSTQVR